MARQQFPLNYQNIFELDTTPNEATPTYARVAAGISNMENAAEDETDDTAYYDGEGFGNNTVMGVNVSLTFTGHRLYGDEAQDYIEDIAFETGIDRETNFRWTQPSGDIIEGPVTISEIQLSGGDANAKGDFGFTVTFNGRPTFTEGNTPGFTIDPAAPTVAVGGTVTLSLHQDGSAVTATAWTSMDTDIATVDTSTGEVTGVAVGTTIIRGENADGHASVSLTVTT